MSDQNGLVEFQASKIEYEKNMDQKDKQLDSSSKEIKKLKGEISNLVNAKKEEQLTFQNSLELCRQFEEKLKKATAGQVVHDFPYLIYFIKIFFFHFG